MTTEPLVTFVVPTRNSARTIGACITSLRTQSYPRCEVVVVDNDSSDGTADIARARGADIVVNQGPERCAQRNAGARAGTGDLVVFIDSDMVLEPGVAQAIVAQFDDPAVGAVVIPEHSFGEGYWAQCKVLEKSLYVGNEQAESARAFRREIFEGVGGWNEKLTAAEDWDLDDRIRAAGTGMSRVDSFIWHDEGRLQLRGTFGKKRYYGRWLAAYLATRDDGGKRLRRTALFDQPGVLVRHAPHTVGMVTMKAVEAAGMVAGMRDARHEVGV
jgi:glycosyltransferase involved in cell wall biosynthesis